MKKGFVSFDRRKKFHLLGRIITRGHQYKSHQESQLRIQKKLLYPPKMMGMWNVLPTMNCLDQKVCFCCHMFHLILQAILCQQHCADSDIYTCMCVYMHVCGLECDIIDEDNPCGQGVSDF